MKHIIKKSALISTALAIGAFFAYQANSRIVLTDLAKENVEAFAVKQALSYMDKDPEKNLPKLLDWFDKLDHGRCASCGRCQRAVNE